MHIHLALPKRKHIRLSGFDYSQPGSYFITICCHNRARLFGKIENGTMVLNELGATIEKSWLWLQTHYLYVAIDEFIVMPDHFHAILSIKPNACGCNLKAEHIKTVSQLIGAFKTVSSKEIHGSITYTNIKIWQRNYWERIIRTEPELHAIRQYIRNNPKNWIP